MSNVITYQYPESCPRSEEIHLRVNGESVFVFPTNVAYFGCVSFTGDIELEVTTREPIRSATVRPLSRGIRPEIRDNHLTFKIDTPMNLSIEIEGLPPLFFYGYPPENGLPDPDNSDVIYFKGGTVYEIGELNLQSNQTLYLEGGAIIRGNIHAVNAQNIRIMGRGILDGSFYKYPEDRRRSILLEGCEKVRVEDIIMIRPTSWMLVLGRCRDVYVRNLKTIGEVPSSDGIDICGSSDVIIEDCFCKNNDDCIAVKALDLRDRKNMGVLNHRENVENVSVRNCVFINDQCGNAMEIGHELRTGFVRNITFQNCDVLSVHGHGAVFSIHNCDRATVSDVRYEDIRIEHCFDRLIDLRVMTSFWARDEERGQIRNVRFKNIHMHKHQFNDGYTLTLIGGYDPEHTVENVVIEDFHIDERKVESLDEIYVYSKYASGIELK